MKKEAVEGPRSVADAMGRAMSSLSASGSGMSAVPTKRPSPGKRGLRRLGAVALALGSALSLLQFAAAEEYTWIAGDGGAWSAGGNWQDSNGGTGVAPGSGDVAIIPAGKTVVATDADSAFVLNLAAVRLPDATSKIVWNVSGSLETSCVISGAGTVEKSGAGTMRYTSKTVGGIRPAGGTTVNDGILVLPDYANGLQYNDSDFGRMTVNAPGILYTASPMRTKVTGLWGDGTVTNGGEWQLCIHKDPAGVRSQFAGKFAGALRITPQGDCDIVSTNSDNTGSLCLSGGMVGVKKIGNANSPSSLGKPDPTARGTPTGLIYLGDGETTSRTFFFGSGSGMFTWDAGANGGVTFTGAWGNWQNSMESLVLDGTNRNVCTISGTYSETGTAATHLTKRGSGTWALRGNRNIRGAIAVEEGTLQFDSLAETNKACSLGLASVLHSDYIGARNDAKAVDYAILLGTPEKEGCLEYTGASAAEASTRRIAVHGKGRLKSEAAGALSWGGVRNADSGASELVLETGKTGGCAVADVADGEGKGPLSLRKKGDGRWTITGDLTFTGGMSADAGTLKVVGPSGYSWYRWYAMQRCNTNDVWVQIYELGLFDAEGRRINLGYAYNSAADGNNKVLAEGEWAATMSGWTLANTRTMLNLVDDKTTDWCIRKSTSAKDPQPASRDTWIGAAFHMTNGAPPVASYDFVNAFAYAATGSLGSRSVIWSRLEASVDGEMWECLGEVVSNAVYAGEWQHGSTGAERAYANGDGATKLHQGFPLEKTRPSWTFFPNGVEYVEAARGAKISSNMPIVARGLRLDISRGGGTLENIVFAESGKLEVVGADGAASASASLTLVGCSGMENVRRWTLYVDGEPARNQSARMSSDGKVSIFPVGSAVIIR